MLKHCVRRRAYFTNDLEMELMPIKFESRRIPNTDGSK